MKRTLLTATACILALAISVPAFATPSESRVRSKQIVMREAPHCVTFDQDCAGRIVEFVNSYAQLAIACMETPSMRPVCQAHFSMVETQLLALRGSDDSSNPLENGKVLDTTRFINQIAGGYPSNE